MLINTVVLFLRDALPAFILVALLLNTTAKPLHQGRVISIGALVGAIASVLLMQGVLLSADWWNGIGNEVLFSVVLLVFFACALWHLCLLPTSKRWQHYGAMILLISVSVSLNGASLYTYLYSFWSRGEGNVLMLGTLLGIGISLCVAIILYYAAQWLALHHSRVVKGVLLLHIAGQMNQTLFYFEQIGWVSTGESLWNTSQLISERSEVGHFFTALVGYKEAPSIEYLGLFAVWVVIPIVVSTLYHNRSRNL